MLNLTLADPQAHRSLTVYPLVAAEAVELPYVLLADALAAGSLRITELGDGTVPELLATTKADADVLILDGEQLIGAKQNRMTNRSLLLPARGETRIPVSCMEQGRWRYVGEEFGPSPFNAPSSVRRRTRESESDYVAADLAVPLDALADAQLKVWDSIAMHADKLGARSASGALNYVHESRAADVAAWERHFARVDNQVGLLAFVGDRRLGLDVIGGCALYARLHERLLRGYIVDALEAPDAAGAAAGETAQAYLDRVREARRVAAPTVGRGSYNVLAGEVIGGELLDGERVAHLSAFPLEGAGGPGAGPVHDERERPLPPPSRRRRG